MKKLLIIICISMLFLEACSTNTPNITFVATIESVHEGGVTVITSDHKLDFDRASVEYDKSLEIPTDLLAGQSIEITILPQIKESYPVQVTAVEIKQIGEVQTVEYHKISGDEAAKMMSDDVIVLDVRTQQEYDEGHIKNAVLLPLDTINEETVSEYLQDKGKTILVYCRTGRRSEEAAKQLIELGYTDVYDFGGIVTDWDGEIIQ